MVNKPKIKGTAAETALLRWLHGEGMSAVRNPPAGNNDIGDLTVGDFIPVEVKNMKNVAAAIREGLRELDVEKANAGTANGVLVVKPPGVGLDRAGDWYAIRRVKDDPEIGAA